MEKVFVDICATVENTRVTTTMYMFLGSGSAA